MNHLNCCHRCHKRLRSEIQMYNEGTLYFDKNSEGLWIKTDQGIPVGCFYCLPYRTIKNDFLYLRDGVSIPEEKEKPSLRNTSKTKPVIEVEIGSDQQTSKE